VSAPVAFIFGGEVGKLLPEVVVHCDAGAFIPSAVRLASQETDLLSHQTLTGENQEDALEAGAAIENVADAPRRLRTHSCNLCIAACIVLSERFRHRLTSRKM